MILVTIWQNAVQIWTVRLTQLLNAEMWFCVETVFYYSYYVPLPAINLGLLIGNNWKSWWASQM